MNTTTELHVLLCSRDPTVIEAIEVSAAALDVPLRVVNDAGEARAQWSEAALRLVGAEVALRWSSVAPGPAFVVGADAADLARCSAQLGLPVLPLPDDSGRLADVMAKSITRAPRHAPVVSLLGASGGLGVSTLTVALALLAARSGKRAVGVDLAHGGLSLIHI